MYTDWFFFSFLFRLDLNMELPQGQTGSVGASVASAEQVNKNTLTVLQEQFILDYKWPIMLVFGSLYLISSPSRATTRSV